MLAAYLHANFSFQFWVTPSSWHLRIVPSRNSTTTPVGTSMERSAPQIKGYFKRSYYNHWYLKILSNTPYPKDTVIRDTMLTMTKPFKLKRVTSASLNMNN